MPFADEGTSLSSSRTPRTSKRKPAAKPAPKGWRRFFSRKRILLALLAFFVLGVTALGVAYAMVSVPQPNDLANAQASIIYYSDGKTEMERISEVGGNRESVPLTKIPLHVQQALLAAEDRSFYQNNGVSPSGIARAVVVAVKGGPTQGGSTITQQYVKNYFLTQDQTISRKAKELIIAIKIDQQESKQTILANYLNTIYYGRGANGIQTAAKAYFGHDASKLTIAEGALLASVIRGPAFYDPALGATQKASARARVNYVLDGMVTQGWLSPETRAKTKFPKTIAKPKASKAGPVGYITEEVKRELTDKLKVTDYDIDRGGLRIVTTISRKAQASAVKAVDENLPSQEGVKASMRLHVGLTAIRPGDGAIVAMYGGKDYSKRQFNSSTQAELEGGSTFKVFGMLAAGQKEISTKTTYPGYSPQFFPEMVGVEEPRGRVRNSGSHQYGRLTLRDALAESVNTIFAQLNIDLADGDKKAEDVKNAAILAGLPKDTTGLGTGMRNIFGSAAPRVVDMANAYATIAAEGERATPYLISKVTSVDGSIDYKVKKKLTQAFDKKVTADVTEAMTRVVTDGTGSGALALGRPAAGKTGTSENNRAVWFDGFTPQLSAAVGMYQFEGKKKITVEGIGEVFGGGIPVEIWTAFMKGALEGEKVIDFPSREGVGDSLLPPPPTTPPTTIAPTTAPPTTPPTTATPTTAAPTTAAPTLPVPTLPSPTKTRTREPGPREPEPAPPAAQENAPPP
jgi:membrane peptidoglycan carboxypeptidase